MYIDTQRIVMRELRDDDLSAVESILRLCFVEAVAERFVQEVSNRSLTGMTYMVADHEGSVIGLMAYIPCKNQDAIYFALLAVCPHCQERGVGRMMVEWLKAKLPDFALKTIALHVQVNDEVPQHLYATCGFETIETIPNLYPDGGGAHHMQYRIR